MGNLKNYQLGFDLWGLGLFLLIMLPNFVWFAVPAPNDVLRRESVTPLVDAIAQVFQAVMAAALCAVVNTARDNPVKRGYLAGTAACAALYFAGWIAYYAGIANAVVILALCLAPCGAFLVFALGRKNGIALVSGGIFALCHLIFSIVNFLL